MLRRLQDARRRGQLSERSGGQAAGEEAVDDGDGGVGLLQFPVLAIADRAAADDPVAVGDDELPEGVQLPVEGEAGGGDAEEPVGDAVAGAVAADAQDPEQGAARHLPLRLPPPHRHVPLPHQPPQLPHGHHRGHLEQVLGGHRRRTHLRRHPQEAPRVPGADPGHHALHCPRQEPADLHRQHLHSHRQLPRGLLPPHGQLRRVLREAQAVRGPAGDGAQGHHGRGPRDPRVQLQPFGQGDQGGEVLLRDDLQEPVPADPEGGRGPAGLPERAFGQARLQPVLLQLPA